jgi:hypothetical protein
MFESIDPVFLWAGAVVVLALLGLALRFLNRRFGLFGTILEETTKELQAQAEAELSEALKEKSEELAAKKKMRLNNNEKGNEKIITNNSTGTASK